ncbi:3'-5' exonuclease [Pelomonas aquatica]|jgi:hypothetical protein|uniref:Uncharacterized protein n=1 Tax=Pelomonas aquatica TaxID=431058 RepID=A0A9X4R517_9BURK|nr:hypothetical protein [Pelomonas aquatica]MCY4755723.1 hypothetical protein [Pelomonas aquatica]MDG0862709.1 hypothetical protein [Pelomonas aquatica]
MQLPTILDIEASGFGRGSYPIEVGFVAGDGTLFCGLVRPEPDWLHWDEAAEALHGISRELLLKNGRPVRWMAEQINRRLQGQTVYCDGWGLDYPWMARLYDAAGLQPSFRLDDLRRLLSETEALRWRGVTEAVRRRQQLTRHRASSDARVLQLALEEIKNGVTA